MERGQKKNKRSGEKETKGEGTTSADISLSVARNLVGRGPWGTGVGESPPLGAC